MLGTVLDDREVFIGHGITQAPCNVAACVQGSRESWWRLTH